MMLLYRGMKKYIKLVILVIWMGLIFFFSAQQANESTITTNVVVDLLYKIYSYFVSDKVDFNTFNVLLFAPTRKIAHFTEFAILGLLTYLNIKEYKNKKVLLISVLLASLYAISDEIHQIYVPGRYCDIKDMALDIFGVIIGVIFIHLFEKRCIKK